MRKRPNLNEVVARNLAYFMARPGCPYDNPTALARAAEVAPNTVRNLLDPSRRGKEYAHTSKREGAPNLDMLERIATAFDCDVWELLHPDIERAKREHEMYRKIEEDFARKMQEEPTLTYRDERPIKGTTKAA